MTDDRRVAYRANAFTFGAVEMDGGEIGCLVWDATALGAQIEVETPDRVPERFMLRLSPGASPREAAVAWRRSRRIGITFRP